ncbi:13317_t:CDS:2, partial [Racocetra fulgida]
AFKEFGMDLEMEFKRDIEAIQYLGNKVYRNNKQKHPEIHRQYQLWHDQHQKASQTYNTALQPDLYRLFANEYIEDVINLARFYHVKPPKMALITDQKFSKNNKWFLQVQQELTNLRVNLITLDPIKDNLQKHVPETGRFIEKVQQSPVGG